MSLSMETGGNLVGCTRCSGVYSVPSPPSNKEFNSSMVGGMLEGELTACCVPESN